MKQKTWTKGALEMVRHCPACGSSSRSELNYQRCHDDMIFLDIWSFVQCAACHSLYLDPRPDKTSLSLAYEQYYTHDEEKEHSRGRLLTSWINGYLNRRYGMHRLPASFFGYIAFSSIEPLRLKLDYYARHLQGTPGRLLDVGCGNGGFLLRAREMGWKAEGCDPDSLAVQTCRNLGLQVRHGDVFSAGYKPESFDTITLSHVLEHVHDPARLIAHCYTLLTPGGRLWLATPNPNSIGLHMFHQSWIHLHPPYHLVILSQHALLDLLKQAGFCNPHMLRRGLQSKNLWHKSIQIAQREGVPISRAYSLLIRGLSELAATLSTRWGEETVIITHKPQ